jgi:hypothetical protein
MIIKGSTLTLRTDCGVGIKRCSSVTATGVTDKRSRKRNQKSKIKNQKVMEAKDWPSEDKTARRDNATNS